MVLDSFCGRELVTLEWKSEEASAVLGLEEGKAFAVIAGRLGVKAMGEASLMKFSGKGAALMGVDGVKAEALGVKLASIYKEMDGDVFWKDSPSLLGYCLSGVKPKVGRGVMYLPKKVREDLPVLVFIHGYGGSFRYYIYLMAEMFPEYVIVAPAYGLSGGLMSEGYFSEVLREVRKQVKVEKPILIGLSAGGFGGYQEYLRNCKLYRGMILLGAFPGRPSGDVRKLRVGVLGGAEEGWVKGGRLRRADGYLRGKAEWYEREVLAGGDHFFLVMKRKETGTILKKWVGEME